MVLPSDTSLIVAVTFLALAVDVASPTDRCVLSVAPGASSLNEPLAIMPAVAPPMLALRFSEKPSIAAMLLMVSAWLTRSPR